MMFDYANYLISLVLIFFKVFQDGMLNQTDDGPDKHINTLKFYFCLHIYKQTKIDAFRNNI